MRLWVLCSLAFAVAACSESKDSKTAEGPMPPSELESDRALCTSAERDGLINPETMEVFDFRRLQPGDSGFDADKSVLESLGVQRLRQYYLRYKADSQVGLKVTSQKRCDINETKKNKGLYCGCIEWNIAVAASQ